VELRDQIVDVRVHDRFPHQGEGAVGHVEGFLPPEGGKGGREGGREGGRGGGRERGREGGKGRTMSVDASAMS